MSKREMAHRMRAIRIFSTVICIAIAFMLGFVLRGNESLMKHLGIGLDKSAVDTNPGQTVTGNTSDSISARIAEIEGILNTYSIDTYNLDSATSSLIGDLVGQTKDFYAYYYDKSRYEKYLNELSSTSYNGVGVLFAEYTDGSTYVADVFEGSPAQAAGIQKNDFVVAINGNRQDRWILSEVTNAVSNANDSSVVITWRRPKSLGSEGGDEYTTTLTIGNYLSENVSSYKEDTVGVIKIRQLTQNSANLVLDEVKALSDDGAKAIVLDLRDCPGGYLTQAVQIAGLFIDSGTIVQIQTKDEVTTKSAEGTTVSLLPMVVIVNENTASSAEVLAAALQESGRAQIVGTKTMGKGSVQIVKELSFGGAIRYTAAIYKTPLGHEIEGTGISPDISVSNSASQTSIAIQTAQSKI